MDIFLPSAVAAHMMKRVPMAPPALKIPFAVAMASVVLVAYPGSPCMGRSKKLYHPGWPMVEPMMDEQYPYV